jgi:hypothetical protein
MDNGQMIREMDGEYLKIEKWDINISEIGNKIGKMDSVDNRH